MDKLPAVLLRGFKWLKSPNSTHTPRIVLSAPDWVDGVIVKKTNKDLQRV
jgi:hypothetical protein